MRRGVGRVGDKDGAPMGGCVDGAKGFGGGGWGEKGRHACLMYLLVARARGCDSFNYFGTSLVIGDLSPGLLY